MGKLSLTPPLASPALAMFREGSPDKNSFLNGRRRETKKDGSLAVLFKILEANLERAMGKLSHTPPLASPALAMFREGSPDKNSFLNGRRRETKKDGSLAVLFKILEANLERAMGIEPTLPAWEAGVLPLNYARISI